MKQIEIKSILDKSHLPKHDLEKDLGLISKDYESLESNKYIASYLAEYQNPTNKLFLNEWRLVELIKIKTIPQEVNYDFYDKMMKK